SDEVLTVSSVCMNRMNASNCISTKSDTLHLEQLSFFFFFKQKTAYEIGLGIPAEPLFKHICLIRVRNIRALNGRFNTSITHAYSIVIGSKHITLNATGGGFLTASKQFRHGATSKSRSNTASNSTKHKSPHLSGWRQIISLIT